MRRTPTSRGRYGQDDLMTCHDREHFDGKLAVQDTAAGATRADAMPRLERFWDEVWENRKRI
jgi:hypothetical protein